MGLFFKNQFSLLKDLNNAECANIPIPVDLYFIITEFCLLPESILPYYIPAFHTIKFN